MIKVKYPVIVEGRYDKIKLSSIIEGDIITTNGFGIFRDKKQLAMVRRLAERDRVILLTDSDRAGFRIRSYLAGALPPHRVIHIYIPEVHGKERRKEKPSAEGTLGVEGVSAELLREAFAKAGVLADSSAPAASPITKQQLYQLGLSGGADSAVLRREVQRRLGLPGKLGANALCGMLTRLTTIDELTQLVAEVKAQHKTP